MQIKALLLLVCLVTFGAGCSKSALIGNKPIPPTPTISVSEPALSSTTTDSQIRLVGSSNMPQVWIGQSIYDVKDGKFETVLDLKDGLNEFPVWTGNGIVTSTMAIKIEKIVPATSTSAVATAPTKTTISPRTAAKSQPKPAAAPKTQPQVPVTFSSSEMKLTASLGVYGAQLNWSKAFDPFQSYVLVKSQTDPNVYFPKVFWFQAINDIDFTTFTDRDTKAGKTYYRVCKLKPDQSAVCGNVASVNK